MGIDAIGVELIVYGKSLIALVSDRAPIQRRRGCSTPREWRTCRLPVIGLDHLVATEGVMLPMLKRCSGKSGSTSTDRRVIIQGLFPGGRHPSCDGPARDRRRLYDVVRARSASSRAMPSEQLEAPCPASPCWYSMRARSISLNMVSNARLRVVRAGWRWARDRFIDARAAGNPDDPRE